MDNLLFWPFLILTLLILLIDIFKRKSLSVNFIICFVVVFVILLPSKTYNDDVFWFIAFLGIVTGYVFELAVAKKNYFSSEYNPHLLRQNKRVNEYVRVLGIIGISISFWQVAVLVYEYGGFVNALVRSRVDAYLKGGVIESTFLKSLSYLLMPFVILTAGYFFERNVKLFVLVATIVVVHLLMTADTRLPLLFFVFTPIYLWFFGQKNLTKAFIMLFFLPLFVLSFVAYANIGALLRSGVAKDITFESVFNFSNFTSQLGYRGWVNDLVNHVGHHGPDYGWQWLVAPWLNFIPRFIWTDKPITSTSNLLHEVVGGMKLGDGNYITTYTIFGEGYYQYQYLGVWLAPILFAFSYYVIMFFYRGIYGYQFFAVWTLFRFLPFVRAEQPLFLLITLIVEIIIVRFLGRIK